MTKTEFLLAFQDLLGREGIVNIDDTLADLEEWDSLAMMSVIAWFDKHISITLNFNQLKALQTVVDIIALSKNTGKEIVE